jgi:hypothetical protein
VTIHGADVSVTFASGSDSTASSIALFAVSQYGTFSDREPTRGSIGPASDCPELPGYTVSTYLDGHEVYAECSIARTTLDSCGVVVYAQSFASQLYAEVAVAVRLALVESSYATYGKGHETEYMRLLGEARTLAPGDENRATFLAAVALAFASEIESEPAPPGYRQIVRYTYQLDGIGTWSLWSCVVEACT